MKEELNDGYISGDEANDVYSDAIGDIFKKIKKGGLFNRKKKGGLFKRKKGGLLDRVEKTIKKRQDKKAADQKKIDAQIKAIQKTPAIKLPPMAKMAKEKGMGMGAKIAIGAGGVMVLGLLGFLIYKAVKK